MSEAGDAGVHLGKIGQIAITVRDLDRAREFYRDTLGMKFLFDAGTMSFFQCGEVRLMIAAKDGPCATGGTILYFKVDGLQATYEALQAREVPFFQAPHITAKMPEYDLWMAFLKDPDGNIIGLMCELPRAQLAL